MSHNNHGRRVQRCTFPKERRPRTANEQTCTCKLSQCKCTRPRMVRARHNASSCKCLALLSPPRSQCILKQQPIKYQQCQALLVLCKAVHKRGDQLRASATD